MDSISLPWQDVHFQLLESQMSALLHEQTVMHRIKRSKSKDAPLIFIPEMDGKQ